MGPGIATVIFVILVVTAHRDGRVGTGLTIAWAPTRSAH